MTTETGTTGESNAPVTVEYVPPADTQEALSLDDAFRMITEPEKEKEAESAKPATAEQESPSQEDGAESPEQETTAEDQGDEPEVPAIEPPRSWSKEAHERWSKLDRETQEWLVSRDSEDQKAIKRSFNEAAEAKKAAEAKLAEVDKVRQQYEAQLPALMKELESVNQAQFGDIKTMDDVVKLQAEDPFRFQAWQVHQMRLQATNAENYRVAQEKSTIEQSKWAEYVQKENAKAAELIPDLADKDKAEKMTKRVATELLPELGFTDSELSALANGKEKLSIYDHRLQQLLADSLKYRDLQKAPAKAITKPVPQVQRPGSATPRGAAQAQSIQALNKRLETTGSVDDAFALWQAQRKAS